MKKVSYMVLFIALAVVVLLILSPGTSGRSDNPCSSGPGCHGSQYYQYLDILEGDSASQIPSAIEVGETKTVSVVVENTGNPGSYATLSGVSVTLTSKNGYFSVSSPTYSIGDLPLGKKTATFQITGVSEGFDSLSIAARGDNKQHLVALTFSFSDSYSSSITVGHPAPTPTPPPANTPTPTLTPSPTVTPTVPTPTPSTSTPNPEATPTPAPTNQLAVQLMSPSNGEQWAAGTMRSIIWNTNGGTDPLTITLEYSVISIDGPWVAIATGMPNNGSLAWKTPNTASIVYIRAVITDSANPPQTASTISSVEITGANVEFPLILIPVMLIPAIAMLTVLFKRRRTKGNNASKLKAPVNLHVKSESLKRF